MNVYQMIVENGYQGFWIARNSWGRSRAYVLPQFVDGLPYCGDCLVEAVFFWSVGSVEKNYVLCPGSCAYVQVSPCDRFVLEYSGLDVCVDSLVLDEDSRQARSAIAKASLGFVGDEYV